MSRGVLVVLLAAASWGTWSLFLRPTGLPPTATTPIVFFVMGLVTLPFTLRASTVAWTRRTRWLLVGNAVFDAANLVTFFGAMAYTTVAIAVLTHYLAPVFIALAAPRVEKISARGARPAAVVALAGLVIILEPWNAPAKGAIPGAILGAISASCYMANTFIVRRLAEEIGVMRAMSWHSLLAGGLTIWMLFVADATFTVDGVALVVAGAITIGAGSGVIYVWGLGQIGSARAGVLAYAEPLVAVAVGVLVWAEPFSPLVIVGGVLVVGSGIAVIAPRRQERYDA